jgi:hypothetical protein
MVTAELAGLEDQRHGWTARVVVPSTAQREKKRADNEQQYTSVHS